MQIELRQIQRTLGTTTVLVTHDQSEAMALADRVVVMNRGRVEQIAAPHEAYERPATPFVASFLGKTNVLQAVMETRAGGPAHAVLGDQRWPVPPGLAGRLMLTVRPEKIAFAADGGGLAGTVTTRIFQGNHWLYRIETAHGLVTVIRQNSGEAAPEEGATVHLTWRAEDMSVRATL